jgi:hypothetical protein
MNTLLPLSFSRSGSSVDDSPRCHADDAPRLRHHLPEVSGLQLHGLMGDLAVLAPLPCPGCDLWAVSTGQGVVGISNAEWDEYTRLRETGTRMARALQARRDGRMCAAGDSLA